MAGTVTIIGIQADELPWIRLLVQMLRHPDPMVPELARQALLYLEASAARPGTPTTTWLAKKIAVGPSAE